MELVHSLPMHPHHPKQHLYVLSGTGNSLRAACWWAEWAGEGGAEAQVHRIEVADPARDLASGDKDGPQPLVGFFFPAHGFMPPWSMWKFLVRLPRRRGVQAVIVPTRGAVGIAPVLLPGAAGLATYLAMMVVLLKGWRVVGARSLDMPSNLINGHWGLHERNVTAIQKRARRQLGAFHERIAAGRAAFPLPNHLWELAWSTAILWWIPWLLPAYLAFARIFMGKLMLTDARCKGCRRCERNCPNSAIRMRDTGEGPRPYWTYHCETCMRCMAFCPQACIQASFGWMAILLLLTSSAALTWTVARFGVCLSLDAGLSTGWPGLVLGLVWAYVVTMAAYALFWQALRLAPLRALFTWTSPSRWWRRYHEPDTRARDLRPPKRAS